VTHDRVEALALGDRMAVLTDRGVHQVGAVHEVFSAPADLVVARVVGTENVAPARLVERRDGLALVEVGGGAARLWAVDPGHLEAEAYACIRAEEVALEPEPPPVTSARNRLAGTVRSAALEGALVRVTIDCGFPLVALVTRDSAEQLAVAPGRRVAALLKTPAIRLVPRPR
jgi:molybdate transport system ATP-binding protein